MISLGMVGCGWATRTHAAVLTRMNGVCLRSVVAPSDRVEAFAREFGIPVYGHNIDHLFDDSTLDGLLVCVPPHVCLDIVNRLISRGLPILIEKPVGRTSAEVSSLLTRPELQPPIVVGLQYRSGGPFRRLQHHLDVGSFGKLTSVYHRMHFPSQSNSPQRRAWALDPALAIGALIEVGIHGVDVFLKLFGPARKATSSSVTVDGVVVAGRVSMSHDNAIDSVVDVSYFGGFNQHSGLTEIQGQRGFVCFDRGTYADRRAQLFEEFGGEAKVTLCEDVGFTEQLARFLTGIRTGQFSQLPTLEDAIAALRVIESATTSAGQPSSTSNHLSQMTCTPITGKFVAVLGHHRTDRGMVADKFQTRCVRHDEVHEIIFVRQDPGPNFHAVWYGGFVTFFESGVIARGSSFEIDGQVIGEVVGFDTSHLPNHLNILVATHDPKAGQNLGLNPDTRCRFLYKHWTT